MLNIQQTIIWINYDRVYWCICASLGLSELILFNQTFPTELLWWRSLVGASPESPNLIFFSFFADCQIGTRPSTITILTGNWPHDIAVAHESYYQITCYLTYRLPVIIENISKRDGKVGQPLASLLLTVSSSHDDNALWDFHVVIQGWF